MTPAFVASVRASALVAFRQALMFNPALLCSTKAFALATVFNDSELAAANVW